MSVCIIEIVDVLADLLQLAGVHGTLGARIDAGADWGWWAQPEQGAAFHAVTSGTAYVQLDDGRPLLRLDAGDVLLLPTGAAHVLGSDAAAVQRTSAAHHDDYEELAPGVIRIGRGATQTHILCAHYGYDPAVRTQLLQLLPDVVHLQSAGDGLDDAVRLLGRELAHPQLAGTLVLDRLVDVLLVQLLRAWLAAQPETLPPGLGALRDPVAAQAVARLHADPARAWTTTTLAAELAVSRATLTRHFTSAVGTSPGAYLTRWRMDLAAKRLRDSSDTLEQVAEAVGYTSVYAFSRAFSRDRALPPGRWRAEARQAA